MKDVEKVSLRGFGTCAEKKEKPVNWTGYNYSCTQCSRI